jgi:putative oxidoreductase
MQTSKRTHLQAWGITLVRVVTGILFLRAGVNNLFFEGSSELPGLIIMVGSVVELLCGAALVVGLLTRWVCIPLALLMVADILTFHPPVGFFLGGEAFQNAFIRLANSVGLALAGPGKVALDNLLAIRRGS